MNYCPDRQNFTLKIVILGWIIRASAIFQNCELIAPCVGPCLCSYFHRKRSYMHGLKMNFESPCASFVSDRLLYTTGTL